MKKKPKQPALNSLAHRFDIFMASLSAAQFRRKGCALLFFCIICSLPLGNGWGWVCFAQDSAIVQPLKPAVKTKNYFVGAEVGYSYLMGNLTGVIYEDPKSGFAQSSGYNVAISGAYWLNKHVGIGGVASLSSFFVNQIGLDSLATGYQRYYYYGDSAKAESATKYNFYSLLVGPYFSLPFKKDKRFSLDARLLGGVTYARTAEFDVVVISMDVPHPFAQNISQSFSWAVQAGASIKFLVSEHIIARIAADAYYTDPNFVISNSNMPANVRQLNNYHQPILMFHFNFGLAYNFGK